MSDDKYKLCNDTFKDIIYTCSYTLSGISLICLSYILIQSIIKTKKPSFIVEYLNLITISEILNCFAKLINLFKDKIEHDKKESELSKRIGYAQLGFTLMSDISTVILSFMISLKIYDSMTKNIGFFKSNYIKLYSRLITLLIPLIITISFALNDIKVFIHYSGFAQDECKTWTWMNFGLSLTFYAIVWCFIISVIVINCMSLRYLNQRVKLLEEEDSVSETERDTNCAGGKPFS